MIDGVDVSDPEGGTIWVFANHNWIQEVQVIGLGANAEYGGFTGVASNSLFRSGSNMFQGLFETLYENDAHDRQQRLATSCWRRTSTSRPARRDYVTDTTFQIGGPIKRDKALVLHELPVLPAEDGARRAIRRRRPRATPSPGIGPDARLEKSPRFLFKPTIKIGETRSADRLLRVPTATRSTAAAPARPASRPKRRVHQDSPEVAWNGNYTKVLSASSVFDVKYSGFWGYYYLTPYNGDDTPGWYDVDEDFYAVNSYYFYNADRVRHQANASLTKFASGLRRRAQPEVRRRVRAQLRQERVGLPGRHVRVRLLRRAVLRVSVGRLPQGQHQQPLSRLSRRIPGRSARASRSTRASASTGSRATNKHLDEQVFATNSFVAAHRLRLGRDGQQQDRRPRSLRLVLRRREVELLRSARPGDPPIRTAPISTSTSTSIGRTRTC